MVDVPSVQNLPDTPAEWTGVPQLEDGWFPTGGAVDPANDNGLLNWPLRQLARRTRFLREQIDGAGIGVSGRPNIADFNTVTLGGLYRANLATPNAPTSSHPYHLLHIAGNGTGEATQMAWHTNENRAFMRRRDGGVWQPWVEFEIGLRATFSHAGNGWQRDPSGLITQWGGSTGALNNAAISFPIAFPNNLFSLVVSDRNAVPDSGGAHIVSYRNEGPTGFNVAAYLHDGTATVAGNGFNFIAIGN